MKSRFIFKKILLIASFIFMLIFFAIGILCCLGDTFYDWLYPLFLHLDSLGFTAPVLIIIGLVSLAFSVLCFFGYEKV